LGAKASPPTVDNDGNALLTGALYWNTGVNKMYVWSGSAWTEISSSAEIIAYKYTVAGGATSVSGADDNGLTLTYTVGKEQVYINGVLQVRGSDYTASTGSSITGISAMIASDIVTVLAFTSFSVSDTYTQAQADAKFFQTANAFLAGKNKIINGDFGVNQRAFTSTTTSGTYMYDRWRTTISGGTATYTAQTFTPGEITGYESKNYIQIVTSGQSAVSDYALLAQKIEDVRTLAGQTVTVSFWAKASTGTPKVGVAFEQIFGTGGSSAVAVKGGDVTISSSWARYSVTFNLPSVTGKTISTSNDSVLIAELWTSAGSNYASAYTAIGIQNATISLWGVQVEAGSIATPFQTATGTLQGELAACQRYYEKSYPQAIAPGTASTTDNNIAWNAVVTTSNRNYVPIYYKVNKRGAPTITLYSPITGTSGKLYNALTSAGDKNATANYIQDYGFAVYLGPTDGANAVGDLLLVHYVASAEL
jgi:hypothetical protein